ncbi:MAG: outer membrane beta-barrel protein [Pseudomonadota bacterium]
MGNLKIVPGISVEEVHDNNIYLKNTNELSDWLTHLKPGLMFDYAFPGARGNLRFGYQGDFVYYDKYDNNDYKNHTGLFDMTYAAPGGILFGLSNTYINAADPYTDPNQYLLGQPGIKRWNDTLKGKIGYDLGNRFRVMGYYNLYKQDYDRLQDYSQDYDENEFGLGLEARLAPKTWGFIRYYYGERDFFSHPAVVANVATNSTGANDADINWHKVNVGLTWDPDAKLSGELNLGYSWNDYVNRADPTGNLYNNKDAWTASTYIRYTATATTTLALILSRSLRPVGSTTNDYYLDTTYGLSLDQILMTKLTLSAGVSYNTNEYYLPLNRVRDDDNYSATINLNYQIQDWLRAGVGYAYRKKDSNYTINDFTDNQFLFTIGAVY